MKFTVLKNTFIGGRSCMAGDEVDLDDSNLEYIQMLLSDGNITRDRAASSNRVPVENPVVSQEQTQADAEAPADPVPLEPNSPEPLNVPSPLEVAKAAELENDSPSTDSIAPQAMDINIQ